MPAGAPTVSPSPPQPLGDDLPAHWMLDPAVTYLDHGCFGATPRVVFETQTRWREFFETRPVERLQRARDGLIAEAKAAVGAFVGARPDDFGFVTNATGGVNAVLRSLKLEAGDELITTNHVYNAIRQTMRFVAGRAGASVREVPVTTPIGSPGDVIEAIAAALGERTRVLVVDHIASPTAVVFPLAEIIEMCRDRDIDVIVDGAHAAGMVELDVTALGPAYYTSNLHKWVCAPKGAAFLFVRADRQQGIHPNTISHFLDEGFATEFGWQGTRDISAWLSAPDAIRFMERFGWPAVRRHNHQMATWVQFLLTQRWGVEPATPLDGSMIGSMASVALPPGVRRRFDDPEVFRARLCDDHHLEIPVIDWDGRWWVRASCQVYNTPEQYEKLGDAVMKLAEG